MYQPKLARFMSRDPLPNSGVEVLHSVPDMRPLANPETHTQPYVYVRNNPINLVDPSGRVPCDPATTLTIAALKLRATIHCAEGKFEPIIIQPINKKTGRPWDRCVAMCIYEHERVHVEQWTKFCPDWCACNDGMVPANPEGVTRTDVECPAYLKERSCLIRLYHTPLACDPAQILAQIAEAESRMKGPIFNCPIQPIPFEPTVPIDENRIVAVDEVLKNTKPSR